MKLNKGEYLFKEGDFNNRLYVLQKGLLKAHRLEFGKTREVETYLPGSLIAEETLLEGKRLLYSVQASVDSELYALDSKNLQKVLAKEPKWFSSLIRFLFNRYDETIIVTEQYEFIRALPAVLYLLANLEEELVDIKQFSQKLYTLNGVSLENTQELLSLMESFGLIQIKESVILKKKTKLIAMLYEALLFRAIHKDISKHILSITEQLLLQLFVELCKKEGFCFNEYTALHLKSFAEKAKESSLGISIRINSISSLEQKQILFYESEQDVIYGDIDYILLLLELNSIYPQLDKIKKL